MKMELRVGVKILLKNREGKYLVLARSQAKYPDVGMQWEIPGGRIDAGATLEENLKREVREETGLGVSTISELLAAQDILKPETGKHTVRLTYLGEVDGEVKLSDEHTDFKWLPLSEIKKLDPIDKYLKEVLENFHD
jgi:8-oxo-dGTP diphosphatase